jgi:DNA-binding beta-propeller fold protein YncE
MWYIVASRCGSLAPRTGQRLILTRSGLLALLLWAWTTVAQAVPILYVTSDGTNQAIFAIEPGQPDRLISNTFLSGIRGLTLGPDGLLYVGASRSGGVRKIDPATGFTLREYSVLLGGSAYDMRFGADGFLYVASHSTSTSIVKLNIQTGVATPFATGTLLPHGLTFGPDGNLYLAGAEPDTRAAQIRRYNGTTGEFIDVFASDPEMGDPHGIEFGPDGNLYVADLTALGSSVLRFDGVTGEFIDVFAFDPNRSQPYDVAFGPHDGNLYLADTRGIVKFNGTTGDFIELYADPPGAPKYMVFAPVPEPSTGVLFLLAVGSCCGKKAIGRRAFTRRPQSRVS